MSLHLALRVIHIVSASLWVGAAFFAAWFILPAVRETGPDGGKVMMAVQRRGWTIVLPVIATTTVVSGVWMYLRTYMGSGTATSAWYGYGGLLGIIAITIGISVVSPSLSKAGALAASIPTLPESERAATMAAIGRLRDRAITAGRILSILTVLAAAMMAAAMYV